MTPDVRLGLILTFIAGIGLPTLGAAFRIMGKWTKVESKLEELIHNMETLVKDKDRTHQEIATTMREDRDATNRRLRWLEENVWRKRREPDG